MLLNVPWNWYVVFSCMLVYHPQSSPIVSFMFSGVIMIVFWFVSSIMVLSCMVVFVLFCVVFIGVLVVAPVVFIVFCVMVVLFVFSSVMASSVLVVVGVVLLVTVMLFCVMVVFCEFVVSIACVFASVSAFVIHAEYGCGVTAGPVIVSVLFSIWVLLELSIHIALVSFCGIP